MGAIDWRKRLRELGLVRPKKARQPQPARQPQLARKKGAPAPGSRQQEIGRAGEERAAAFLESQGLSILARNARYAEGELDIVAGEASTLVFVEVKRRQSGAFGDPAEAVTPAKMRRLRSAALHWMRENPGTYPGGIRFDVISIEDATHRIEWLKGAFDGHS